MTKEEQKEPVEDRIHRVLYQYLVGMKKVDERLPECPDVEEKWAGIANSYIPDGAREFLNYPVASLGWMMYLGMAVAKMWDDGWERYSQMEDLYRYLRDKRGYDLMDEAIREEVLMLKGEESSEWETLVGECASRVNSALMRERIESGTKEAFEAYVACLHQLYLFGAAAELKHLGYQMKLTVSSE